MAWQSKVVLHIPISADDRYPVLAQFVERFVAGLLGRTGLSRVHCLTKTHGCGLRMRKIPV